jgi:hypothetical protein
LIDGALARLGTLDALLASDGKPAFNPERSALLGSACKRRAHLHALRLLAAARTGKAGGRSPAQPQADTAAQAMRDALQEGARAYGRDEGRPGSAHFSSYLALNRLALAALTPWPSDHARADAIELARRCRRDAELAYGCSPNLWDAVMQPEALLVEKLVDGSLGEAGDAGQAAADAIADVFAQALANVVVKPSQLDSLVSQLELLSRFCDALAVAGGDARFYRTASRLLELQQRLHPGRRPRADRPAPPPDSVTPRKARPRRAATRKKK